jgi:hypothetical protein
MPAREELHVIGKIGQQDIFSELFQGCAGVPRQPVFDDIFLVGHCVDIEADRVKIAITLQA